MARFIGIVFGFIAMVLLQGAAAQTAHVVGDSLGWTVPAGGATVYANWASGKTFRVGDTLVFNFTTNAHDVLQVQKSSFDACTSTNAIGNMLTTRPANVTLKTAGEHYYICTFSGHCQLGQKLAITVSGTAADGAPTPSAGPTGSSNPTTPPPPLESSASNVLATIFASILAITLGLLF